MNKENLNGFEKHSAGAIVSHKSKFNDLISYKNEKEITQEFREKWVIPYYMELNRSDEDWIKLFTQLHPEITDDIILQNLGDFNWRTRKTGAFFCSIKNKKEYTDIIGTHLLKSEVCFAGTEYAITLSYFNTDKSIKYLNKYLDYYLFKPELEFNQGAVISAIKYLDEINGTNLLSKHIENWKKMLISKQQLNKKSHESILNSNNISDEIKNKLSDINFDEEIDFEIQTNHIQKRINTIKTIANNV